MVTVYGNFASSSLFSLQTWKFSITRKTNKQRSCSRKKKSALLTFHKLKLGFVYTSFNTIMHIWKSITQWDWYYLPFFFKSYSDFFGSIYWLHLPWALVNLLFVHLIAYLQQIGSTGKAIKNGMEGSTYMEPTQREQFLLISITYTEAILLLLMFTLQTLYNT